MSLPGALVTRAPKQFVAVTSATVASPLSPSSPPSEPTASIGISSPVHADGLIEIVLPSGVSVRVDAHVDGRALRRVLGAVEGR